MANPSGMNNNNNNNILPINDRLHPYYIHHSNNPEFILVSQPLIGENYPSWSKSMLIAFSIKIRYDSLMDPYLNPMYLILPTTIHGCGVINL